MGRIGLDFGIQHGDTSSQLGILSGQSLKLCIDAIQGVQQRLVVHDALGLKWDRRYPSRNVLEEGTQSEAEQKIANSRRTRVDLTNCTKEISLSSKGANCSTQDNCYGGIQA